MTTNPVLAKRSNELGWLASTPPDYPLRFATAGASEAEAMESFRRAVERWEGLVAEHEIK